jgi:hypothetical protein
VEIESIVEHEALHKEEAEGKIEHWRRIMGTNA